MGNFRSLIDGVYNLLLGLGVTARRLPKPAVTLQYPKERWEMPERSRGIVVLLSDKETGELNCTGCLLCEKACPTGAITIEREKNEQKKWYARSFTVDNTICCFCGLCEEACNFAAIKMATMYEFSVYNQSELIYDINRLQELGRDVPYTPRPKKKPAAKVTEGGEADKAGEAEPEAEE
ncbi:MAG: NADH-quinone oxidoreductase subunit I [candidate division Zixibacteria bacterium]|nr:NADH-quinone oxidoreductase subunit I [candidate division Zixibacteria bacterium]MBU1470465.1 NADH-quinone oxidoreductase subunit I [candidate division Zixibacteria bacterium]MBU2625914.1 NADH-quinone oxidoreductase subunit I [candidate division Zixibacteria bacterium]